ncbi:MAG: HAD family hydrolase [bacterium]
MIKAIIFDLWETLGTKNIGISKVFFEHFSVPPEKRVLEKYEKAVQLKIWNSEEDMVRSLLRDFDISLAKENIIWTQNLFREGIEKATLFPGTLELLESIRGRYRLALISNTSIFESKVLDKLKIRNFFDVISFSWEIGILKPSVELFEQTLQKL